MTRRPPHNTTSSRPYWGLCLLLVTAYGCASPYRRVQMGTAQANLGAVATDSVVEVQASDDRYQIDFHITSSDATEVQVSIRCPGGVHEVVLGESMERYRERRLGELQYQRERQEQERAQRAATLSSALSSVAVVQAPGVAVQAEVKVETDVSAAASPVPVQLGPYDRGAQSLHQSIVLPGGVAGQCRMSLSPIAGAGPLEGVSGYMQVVHLVDRARARAQLRMAANTRALEFRASVKADLVARGADPEMRGKLEAAEQERERLAYEANQQLVKEANRKRQVALAAEQARKRELRLQAQADARARVPAARPLPVPETRVAVRVPPRVEVEVVVRSEVDVQAEARVAAALALEAKGREAALLLRRRLIGLCISGGADLYYRARLRQAAFDTQQRKEQEQQVRLQAEVDARIERESRLRLQLIADLGTRETLVAWLIARGADPDYRRKQNEADLMSFEERTREARYRAQREASFEEAELPSALQADVSVEVASTASLGSSRPAPPNEVRPPRPDAQSSWIAGFYERAGAEWIWIAGSWSTPPVHDAVWVPSIEVQLGGQLITRPGSWRTRLGKKVHAKPASARPTVRDHRR